MGSAYYSTQHTIADGLMEGQTADYCAKGGRSMSDAISILLIDGNDRDCDYYAWRLHGSPLKYDLARATTGRAGLDHCARQPIDCVVLEIDLPDMSGFEVLAKLVRSASRPEMAVVILTGHPNPYLLELALKNGAKAALQKEAPSGRTLEKSILNAIASVKRDRAMASVKRSG